MPIFDPAIAERLAAMPRPEGSANVRCAALMNWCAEAGSLHFILPRGFGGEGAPLSHALAVVFELSHRSASAGLIYAMHMGQLINWSGHLGASDYLAAELCDLVARKGLVASVVSEQQTGGNIHRALARGSLAAAGCWSWPRKPPTRPTCRNPPPFW